MDTEENIIPKIAAVSLIGVIGFAAAGGKPTSSSHLLSTTNT